MLDYFRLLWLPPPKKGRWVAVIFFISPLIAIAILISLMLYGYLLSPRPILTTIDLYAEKKISHAIQSVKPTAGPKYIDLRNFLSDVSPTIICVQSSGVTRNRFLDLGAPNADKYEPFDGDGVILWMYLDQQSSVKVYLPNSLAILDGVNVPTPCQMARYLKVFWKKVPVYGDKPYRHYSLIEENNE